MHALDARYHLNCMTSLNNGIRKTNSEQTKKNRENKTDSLVLVLVSYIEELRPDKTFTVFKLSDLGKRHKSRMMEHDPKSIQPN